MVKISFQIPTFLLRGKGCSEEVCKVGLVGKFCGVFFGFEKKGLIFLSV